VYAGFLIRIRPNPNKLIPKFLQAYAQSKTYWNWIKVNSVRSGQPGINGREYASLPLAIPSTRAEQEAIAEALSDAEALIESLNQLIAKKRKIKQGTLQELLTGKRRLPGFSGEWEVKSLGELFEITSSKRVFQSEWKSEGIPFYRARELAVLGEAGVVENELFITRDMYEAFKIEHGIPESGDMLVTGVGTLGKVYVVTENHDFYFKDGNIIWFKIRGSMSAEFLRQLYLTPIVKNQIFDASAGTTVGTYTISGAKKTLIPFPSLSEQAAIATILSDMDTELAALESRLAKARQIKQGMMQELLTGRIRLLLKQ
jgi:type I restriction enzyme S subunit